MKPKCEVRGARGKGGLDCADVLERGVYAASGPCEPARAGFKAHPVSVRRSGLKSALLSVTLRPRCAPKPAGAFTLLEVTVALGIFFIAAFAILGTVSNALKHARKLQDIPVDASMLAAQLSITNKLYENSDSGDFRELGNVYRDYSWSRDINQVGTNGLFEADFTIHHHVGHVNSETKMSVLFFRPESPAGGGGVPIGRP